MTRCYSFFSMVCERNLTPSPLRLPIVNSLWLKLHLIFYYGFSMAATPIPSNMASRWLPVWSTPCCVFLIPSQFIFYYGFSVAATLSPSYYGFLLASTVVFSYCAVTNSSFTIASLWLPLHSPYYGFLYGFHPLCLPFLLMAVSDGCTMAVSSFCLPY